MFKYLTVVSCLISLAFGLAKMGTRTAPSYHINNVQRKFTSNAPDDLPNAMNRTLELTFETDDFTFVLDMELNTKIWGKNTKVFALDSNGKQTEVPRRYRAYQGTGKVGRKQTNVLEDYENEDADCSVNFREDNRFHCVCVTKTDVYHIDAKELPERALGREQIHSGSDTGSGMILTIGSEVTNEDGTKDETPVKSHKRKILSSLLNSKAIQYPGLKEAMESRINSEEEGSSRKLLNDQSYLEVFTNCFDGQFQYVHNLYIGHVTDSSYNTVFSNSNSAITSSIEDIFNDASGANMIYYYQMNIRLVLGTVYIGASYSGSFTYSPAEISSGTDISTRLTQFNTWRSEYYSQNSDTNGLWHLLTNNHPPAGTVGIAWVGVICSYAYGTGVTNYISYSPGTWEIWAHEVGHNFGGNHAFDEGTGVTGGIMDYGDGLYPVGYGAYQFHPTYNQDEVCQEVSDSQSNDVYRWSLIDVDECWYAEDNGPSPTSQPTDRPTDRPTGNPTDRPTPNPTDRPTPLPSPRPTTAPPSASPSDRPTNNPTPNPTDRPTPNPTDRPTNRPTGNPTDRPTPNPTDRPTPNPTDGPTPQPTDRPTDAGDTPQPTASPVTTPSPTDRPTNDPSASPTDRPTESPVIQPTASPVISYEWAHYDTYTACNLECTYEGVTAYKTEIYYCYIAGTTTLVDDTNCDAGSKPTGQAVACTSAEVPTCDSDCGDGVVSEDEVCDTNGENGDCCESDCSGYKRDTLECWSANPIIDASFMESSYELYLFQGDYYAKYSTWYRDFTPDDGYPKLIEGSFPMTSFTSDITAAAYASDSVVYIFQGNSYTIVDLDAGEYAGYPATFTDDFMMPSELSSCIETNGVSAAWVWPCGGANDWIFVYCNGNIGGYAHKEYLFDSVYAYDPARSATFRVRRSIYYFSNSDGSVRRRMQDDSGDVAVDFSGSIFSGTNYTSLDEIAETSCYDENCASCSRANTQICYECNENYVLYGSVKCLNNKTLMYLDFDIYSAVSSDPFFVEGGYSTLVSGDYEYVYTGVTGGNSTSMVFDGSTKLMLEPLELTDDDLYVTNFRISFRFKPTAIDYDKLISIDYDNVQIIIQDNTELSAYSDVLADYIALFKVGNNTWTSSIGEGLQLNEWNTVEMQYLDEEFSVYLNGDINVAAFSTSDFADLDVALKFEEWYIGEDDGTGIVGEMDQISFKEVETVYIDTSNLNNGATIIIQNVQNDDYYTWLAIGIVFLVLTILCTIAAIVSFGAYWKRRKVTKEQNEQMDKDMQSFEVGKTTTNTQGNIIVDGDL